MITPELIEFETKGNRITLAHIRANDIREATGYFYGRFDLKPELIKRDGKIYIFRECND